MQLLDDDMDELFRNAASQYPLKTDGADWDALSSRLQSAQPQPAAVEGVRGNKWVWLGISILMTILFFISYAPPLETGKLPRTGTGIATTITTTPAITTSSLATTTTAITTNTNTTTNNTNTTNTSTNKINTNNNTNTTNTINTNNTANTITNTTTPIKSSTHTTIPNSIFASPTLRLTNNRFNSDKTTKTNNKHTSTSVIGVVTNNTKKQDVNKSISGTSIFAGEPTTPPVQNVQEKLPVDSNTTTPTITTPVQDIPLPITAEPVVNNTAEPVIKETAEEQVKKTPAEPVVKKKQSPAKVQTGLYFGLIASPDISTVKMQHVDKVGYGAGIIVGYRISRSFAVETGLLYDHKNYYSEGSYFSKEKIPYIQYWKIINVNGYCNMYEIPVNVRYFIKNGQNTSWYANAGVSSYLMKKEDYAYKYMTTSGDLKNSSWAYKNATQNWFSIINVGVGLEHNLGAIGKLRVEPYLKIPAKGLGIGDLPITSMGINIGITKSIR
ncbi:MAG: hypothetical protein H6Q26_662 [Bacteroidetes bacterium]|nr:hypothetical protein [Bacteroidota bacterium]